MLTFLERLPSYYSAHAVKQRGSALVVAVFIIVVMLMLVLALSRTLLSSGDSLIYEVLGSRALFAAQSGLELSLVQLFPLDASGSCVSRIYPFSGEGLQGCQALVQCSTVSVLMPEPVQLHQLTSIGSCVANEFTSSRTVSIEVRQ
ncbi:pilus assembly PilX N-terminal domain-containing protein [Arsukibacterium sp.]|uniref:pilus assembly PilX N-terminal domain-containing protein n=1 Tax=Arsukibacterium sp. TaxID=1977258 RepID=UPI002FDB75B9